ncbi:MAG: RusA family crossover junction endodeoxyribonuclease [Oliverpabstia sp.]|nr:MAG TPA: Endodeoxyribonuclease RusA [Caudoviricetes sp.]
MKVVKFTVYGEPKAKGRPRVSVRKSADGEKTFARAYTPKNTVMYENQVKAEYGVQCDNFRFPDEAMLDVRIFAFYGIPKSVSKKKRQEMIEGKIRPVKKPDFDNIAKVICDSLNGIAYRDDAMIVDGMFRKYYSEQPRVEVKIIQIGGEGNEQK